MTSMEIYKKLLEIQTELKAPKSQYNSFGKYNYRSCEDILEAVKPLCRKHGVALMVNDEVKEIGGRFYIQAVATLHELEGDGLIVATAYAREPESKSGMDQSQITGTASSYARKYALNGLFCIDDTKDADTDKYKAQTNRKTDNADKAKSKTATPPPAVVRCKECGSEIKDVTWPNGKKTTAQKMVHGSISKYGVPLCGNCYTLRKANGSESGAG